MIVPVVSGFYGLLIGSFLNVVIHRVPREESINHPRSHCPACGTAIAWFDNVPFISWLVLRGRCRGCSAPISPRYPIVEALSAATFVVVAMAVGAAWILPAFLVFAAVLIALSGIDIDTRKIPNRLLYPAVAAAIVLLGGGALLDSAADRLLWAAAGAALGFTILFAIWFIAPGGMGYGDVRLSGYIGLHLGYFGLGHVALGLFVGFLLGAVVGVVLMAVGGRSRKSAIPFGPFLAAGAVFALAVGDPILDAYLGA
ncbi:MAG: prepilin peptidase [Actinomycetia bacterium]|nr:prepilin peptidase [Actinomycetes bacterium]MCP4958893.1 prepilin peptidase [Actinomycetes bacterium]